MLKKIISLLIIAVIVYSGYAQNGWNIYTCMKDVRNVSLTGNQIWAASTGGLFTFEENNLAGMKKFTTLDGLLSNELTTGFADQSGDIWTGAADGSVSVYYPATGTIRIMADIRNSSEPSRQVNNFFQYGNNMFIATKFCIVKFSITQFQFVDQPYIFFGDLPVKSPVNWVHAVNDTIWAATNYGIAYANVNSSLPIGTSWRTFTTANSVLNRNLINTITYFDNKVFFGTDSGMVYFQNGTLTRFEPLYNSSPVSDAVNNMYTTGNFLYFSSYRNSNRIYRVDRANLNNAVVIYDGDPVNNFKAMSNGDLIIGTKYRGVDIYRNNTHTGIFPNGPFSNLVYNMNVDAGSNLWVVSGSLGGTWSTESGVYKYDGNNWKNYITGVYPEMGGGCCGYVQVYPARNGKDVWVSGFGLGLLKIDGDSLYRFTNTNSPLCNIGPDFVLVEGVKEDNNGNLWLINRACTQPIVNFTTGEKYPVPVSPQFNTLYYMVIDNYNTKWMTFPPVEGGGVQGICYWNESVPSGLIVGATQLGPNITSVNNIAFDKNGEVWVATNNGIAVIADPSQVINTPNSIPFSNKMRIIENGVSTPLTEDVNCIGVDALNNKWIGTNSNGVIYVSPDGSTLIARYNMLNSPLPDNKITSIACDYNKGTVYFGTTKGVVSFKTIAINPLEDCDKIKTGPNPYTIPSDKSLKIDGLVAESSVKILTISGTLVKEFESPGGRVAEWDGKDTYGNLVSSGIYIIVGYNKDGSKACTGKVAVVRK
jgi:ligand-binding sensor domain-containing protein